MEKIIHKLGAERLPVAQPGKEPHIEAGPREFQVVDGVAVWTHRVSVPVLDSRGYIQKEYVHGKGPQTIREEKIALDGAVAVGELLDTQEVPRYGKLWLFSGPKWTVAIQFAWADATVKIETFPTEAEAKAAVEEFLNG